MTAQSRDQAADAVSRDRLVSGRLLARNAVLNLLGQTAPFLAAVLTIPILIATLGTAKFGVLSLMWTLIGYLSVFDLGLGRTITKIVAERLGSQDGHSPSVGAALALMAVFGVVGAALFWIASAPLVYSILDIPPSLRVETLAAFRVVALAIPFVVITTGLRGFLEAYQRFGLINVVRIPASVLTFAGPVLVLPFSQQLTTIAAVLVFTRVTAAVGFWVVCRRHRSEFRFPASLRAAEVGRLLSLGGWMTVSNIVGPLMTYLDRFLVAAYLSVGAVAYYATPYDVVAALAIVPGAIVGVLFPAFALSHGMESARTAVLFERGMKYVFLTLFPLTLFLVTFAPEILRWWIGPEFALRSSAVMRWLAAGMLFNGLAVTPFAMIQSVGRPDWTAKLHLAELPFYVAAVVLLMQRWGVEGVAAAWFLRVALDAVLLLLLASRLVQPTDMVLRRAAGFAAVALAAFGMCAVPLALPFRSALFGVLLIAIGAWVWFALIDPAERVSLLQMTRPRKE